MASETLDLMSAARAVLADGSRLVRDSASAAVVMFVLRGLAMRVERIDAMAAEQLSEHQRVVREHHDRRREAENAQRKAESLAASYKSQSESMLSTLEETRAAIDEATGSAPRSAHSIKLAIDRVKEGSASAATKAWCEALEPVTEMLGIERPGGLAAVERIRSAVSRMVVNLDDMRETYVLVAEAAGAAEPVLTDGDELVEMVRATRRERTSDPRTPLIDAILVTLGLDSDDEDALVAAIRELVDDQRKLREMIRVLSSEIEFVERHEPHVLVDGLVELLRGNLGARTDETIAMCVLRVRDRSAQACRILGTSDIEDIVGAARGVAFERQQASAQAARAAVAIQDALLAAGVAPDRSDLPKSLDDLTAMLPRLSGPTVES